MQWNSTNFKSNGTVCIYVFLCSCIIHSFFISKYLCLLYKEKLWFLNLDDTMKKSESFLFPAVYKQHKTSTSAYLPDVWCCRAWTIFVFFFLFFFALFQASELCLIQQNRCLHYYSLEKVDRAYWTWLTKAMKIHWKAGCSILQRAFSHCSWHCCILNAGNQGVLSFSEKLPCIVRCSKGQKGLILSTRDGLSWSSWSWITLFSRTEKWITAFFSLAASPVLLLDHCAVKFTLWKVTSLVWVQLLCEIEFTQEFAQKKWWSETCWCRESCD